MLSTLYRNAATVMTLTILLNKENQHSMNFEQFLQISIRIKLILTYKLQYIYQITTRNAKTETETVNSKN
jgi:hypothetical protein